MLRVFATLCGVYALDCVQAHLCVQSDSVTRGHSCAVDVVTSPVESVSSWCNGRKALSMYADARTGASCSEREQTQLGLQLYRLLFQLLFQLL